MQKIVVQIAKDLSKSGYRCAEEKHDSVDAGMWKKSMIVCVAVCCRVLLFKLQRSWERAVTGVWEGVRE